MFQSPDFVCGVLLDLHGLLGLPGRDYEIIGEFRALLCYILGKLTRCHSRHRVTEVRQLTRFA